MTDKSPDLAIARELAGRVPIFVAKLERNGDPIPPARWQQTEVDPAAIDCWRPGLALCAVMGIEYDALDVDPRNGGKESVRQLRAELGENFPYVYGWTRTCSGGAHYWIAPPGIGSHTNFRPGLDLKGGKPDGEGRGFVFLPPTVRPAKGGKYDGKPRPYVWGSDPEPPESADESGAELARLILASAPGRGEGGDGSGWTDPDVDALLEHGIREGENQHALLRDLVWKLHTQGLSKPLIRAGWQTVVAKTPLVRPDEPWTAADFRSHWSSAKKKATLEGAETGRRLRLTRASEITPRPTYWLWEDRIPVGTVTLTPGRGGIGKSTFHVWAIANVTRGTLPGAFKGQPRACIIVAAEDSWERTIVPRLIAADADLGLVYRADVVTDEISEGITLSLPRDCKALERAIHAQDVALVSVDPLLSVVDSALDTYKDHEMRRVLEPLGGIADRCGCVFLVNAHFNKSGGSDPLNQVMGADAFGNVVRAAIGFAYDQANNERVLSQVKNNLGKMDLPSLSYRLESVIIETPEGDTDVGRFVLGQESETSVSDILAERGQGQSEAVLRRRPTYGCCATSRSTADVWTLATAWRLPSRQASLSAPSSALARTPGSPRKRFRAGGNGTSPRLRRVASYGSERAKMPRGLKMPYRETLAPSAPWTIPTLLRLRRVSARGAANRPPDTVRAARRCAMTAAGSGRPTVTAWSRSGAGTDQGERSTERATRDLPSLPRRAVGRARPLHAHRRGRVAQRHGAPPSQDHL